MAHGVLIASRKSTTRDRLRAALESTGFVVAASCCNAAEVLAAARRRIDVCIIHLDLPGGGITACRALSAKSRPPRILVLAPSTRERDVVAALRAGADGFVVDDLDPRRIPHVVAELAAGRPVLESSSTVHVIAELRHAHPQREEP